MNEDFVLVNSALDVLNNQLHQAERDLERLRQLRESALCDPIAFVDDLVHGRLERMPEPQKILQVPFVDISRYQRGGVRRHVPIIADFLCPIARTPLYRSQTKPGAGSKLQRIFESKDASAMRNQSAVVDETEDGPSKMDDDVDEDAEEGDEFTTDTTKQQETPSKPAKLWGPRRENYAAWSSEEKARLKELLALYSDAASTKRGIYERIAQDLVTRTPNQVRKTTLQ
eukprot:jgi/Hompol1/7097/HPOL_000743-RA